LETQCIRNIKSDVLEHTCNDWQSGHQLTRHINTDKLETGRRNSEYS